MIVSLFIYSVFAISAFAIPGGWSEWKPVTGIYLENEKIKELYEGLNNSLDYQVVRAEEYRVQVVAGKNYEIKVYVCGIKGGSEDDTCTGGHRAIVSVYDPVDGDAEITNIDDPAAEIGVVRSGNRWNTKHLGNLNFDSLKLNELYNRLGHFSKWRFTEATKIQGLKQAFDLRKKPVEDEKRATGDLGGFSEWRELPDGIIGFGGELQENEDSDLENTEIFSRRTFDDGYSRWMPIPGIHIPRIHNALEKFAEKLPFQVIRAEGCRFKRQDISNWQVKLYVCGKKSEFSAIYGNKCYGGQNIIVTAHVPLTGVPEIIDIGDTTPAAVLKPVGNGKRATGDLGGFSEWREIPEGIKSVPEIRAAFKKLYSALEYAQIRFEAYRVQNVNGKNYELKVYVCGVKSDVWKFGDSCTGGKRIIVSFHKPLDGPMFITNVGDFINAGTLDKPYLEQQHV